MYLFKVVDVERAELYLFLLQQLVVMYHSVPQHCRNIRRTYLPKLVSLSLKTLQETSQQVQYYSQIIKILIATQQLHCVFYLWPGELCGKPGVQSSCHGIPGYGMWSRGAGSACHAIRNNIRPEIPQRLLLHSIVLPNPIFSGKLQ